MLKSESQEPKKINSGKYPLHQKINIFLAGYFKYLILAASLLALLICYFFLLKPRYEAIMSEVDNTQNIQEQEYNTLTLHHSKLLKYIKEYEKIKKQDMEKIRKMIPADYDQEQLFTDFSHLISSQGFILNSISISSASGKNSGTADSVQEMSGGPDNIGRIKLTAEISGVNYASLLNLLGTIENNLRIMDIDSLDWQPDSLSLKLDITTYYLK